MSANPLEVSQEDWHDAALEVVYLWEQFAKARDPLAQAERLVSLHNAMHDLKTWLRGFDSETGTMPWDRDENDPLGSDEGSTDGLA